MLSRNLVRYFLYDFEMVPVAPIITGITFVFTFHMQCISIVRSLYFRIFSASFFITFLSPEIATSISVHVAFSLLRIMTYGLLLGMVLSISVNPHISCSKLRNRFRQSLVEGGTTFKLNEFYFVSYCPRFIWCLDKFCVYFLQKKKKIFVERKVILL